MIARFIAVVFSVLLLSCTLSGGEEYSDSNDIEETVFEKVNHLFEEQADGSVVFATNDPRYWSRNGYTLWAIDDRYADVSSPFDGRSCTVSKSSGYYYTGYGMIFCYGKNSSDQDAMYTLMINTKRQYTVGKAINGEYLSIQGWTVCSALRQDYGASNELLVTYNDGTGIYTIHINGEEVSEFTSQPEVKTSGGSGYIAVLSPYDKFSDDTVRIGYMVE